MSLGTSVSSIDDHAPLGVVLLLPAVAAPALVVAAAVAFFFGVEGSGASDQPPIPPIAEPPLDPPPIPAPDIDIV
jgi:hypothetical protein